MTQVTPVDSDTRNERLCHYSEFVTYCKDLLQELRFSFTRLTEPGLYHCVSTRQELPPLTTTVNPPLLCLFYSPYETRLKIQGGE